MYDMDQPVKPGEYRPRSGDQSCSQMPSQLEHDRCGPALRWRLMRCPDAMWRASRRWEWTAACPQALRAHSEGEPSPRGLRKTRYCTNG